MAPKRPHTYENPSQQKFLSSSPKVAIHCSEYPPRILIYPPNSGPPLSTTSLEDKEEVEEIKNKPHGNPTHNVNNPLFHCQSVVIPLVIPQDPLGIQAHLIQTVVPGFFLNKYAPLNLPQPPNAMPQDYVKLLPMYNKESNVTS